MDFNEMIIKRFFTKPDLSPLQDDEGKDFHYALVGNIIGKHFLGVEKKIVYGTKHFSTNTKVILLPEYGGMGHESIPVYGKLRNSSRKIKIVLDSSYLKNVRVKAIYNSKVMKMISISHFYKHFENSKPRLQGFAQSGFDGEREIE
ncbi:hypothetical protein LX97_02149 [Nonlabens dokdonensis]|nr:hypothetical protein [Nonlabens dokdonensis]PZX39792.1 hypothetical protein LX97_02149 [Nonlabens dokdonensis]